MSLLRKNEFMQPSSAWRAIDLSKPGYTARCRRCGQAVEWIWDRHAQEWFRATCWLCMAIEEMKAARDHNRLIEWEDRTDPITWPIVWDDWVRMFGSDELGAGGWEEHAAPPGPLRLMTGTPHELVVDEATGVLKRAREMALESKTRSN